MTIAVSTGPVAEEKMREFTLDHVVSAISAYSGMINSLWGLFIIATFSAAGFGASMKDEFTPSIALLLCIAFLAFAAGHLRALIRFSRKQTITADELGERFRSDPEAFTDYPRSVGAILEPALSVRATCLIHLTIDACVIGIVAANAL